jgi:hypothetical protein
MLARAVTLIVAVGAFARCTVSADDPLLNITTHSIQGSGVEYVWSIRQSHLASLPHCDPLHAEVPVSPHQAITAARDFLRSRFPDFEPQGVDLFLLTRGLEPNPIAPELWLYEISFLSASPDVQHPLSTVRVLMDGKVLVPLERPEKPNK